jgi:DNA excision repair protein ERCC-2
LARKKKAEKNTEVNPSHMAEGLEQAEQEKPPVFKVSVRNLVAFSIPDDTTWSFTTYFHLQEGTQVHSEIQSRHRTEGAYRSEVYLSYPFETKKCMVEISGRADGVWELEDETIIHEIKTTSAPLSEIHEDFSEAHWAQGKCYAYIYAASKNLDRITVRLTYFHRPGRQEKSFDRTFTFDGLKKFVKSLVHPFAAWALSQEKWRITRNLSIKALEFPFPAYREGQRLLAYNTFKCIEDGRRLFAQAPTGTGKTMGVLYPAIKAIAEGTIERIFYLTAKNTTRAVAENAYRLLTLQGLRLRVLTLTAKDKICPHLIRDCNPDKCQYIQGYTHRSRKGVKELIKKTDTYNMENITETAMRHTLCPFELSLDIALQCDLIICDYNYVFDPRISLKRFFQQKTREDCLLLVDEAHNLFDRAREMYSASINKKEILDMARQVKKDLPEVYKALRGISKSLVSLEKKTAEDRTEAGGISYHASRDFPDSLTDPVAAFINETEGWMLTRGDDEEDYTDALISLFFDLLHFKNISELYSSEYRTMITGKGSRLKLTLLCLDPGIMLGKVMDTARSSILFSATLSPLSYFRDILGGREEDATLRLPSPFPRENLLVVIEDCVETRFRCRDKYLEHAARAIHQWVSGHTGNYMVFFPSYKYMTDVMEVFERLEGDFRILCQEKDMDESSRKAFLGEFDTYGDITRIGFCVMGGIFGEGIDLTGDRLTGVVIVGVGLPQVCPEQEIMRSYYDDKMGSGFSYAYTYPGINRVLQASGRLIRSETDRGALLLIDSRFGYAEYLRLLPDEWHPIPRTSAGNDLNTRVFQFWEKR